MNVIEIKNFENNPDNYQSIGIDEDISKYNNIDILSVKLYDYDLVSLDDDRILKVIYTDEKHPVVLNDKTIYINNQYYMDNKVKIDKLIGNLIKITKEKSISIGNSALVSNSILRALKDNENIEEVSICDYNEDDKYIMSLEDYKFFKETNIKQVNTSGVCDQLEDVYDKLIGYNYRKSLIGIYNYEDLKTLSTLYIETKLDEKSIDNLKYLSKSSTLKLKKEAQSITNILNINNRLKELNKSNKIVIEIENKEKLNQELMNYEHDFDNIYVELELEILPLSLYKKMESKLYDMVKPALSLSPFERYIYAYNLVKKYKEYKENPDDLNQSRDLYKILENEYMVCVGFSKMFGDLLDKLDIKNEYLSQGVDSSYDNYNNNEEELLKDIIAHKEGHARRLVCIKDDKYGINGIYTSDPTWDNDLKHDYYSYLALTANEVTNINRYNYIIEYDATYELLTSQNIEEFYEKLNFYLTRTVEKNMFDNQSKIENLINDLLVEISKLDNEYYNYLTTKYEVSDINNDLIYELASYVTLHNNNLINGTTIAAAVSEIYRKVDKISEDEINKRITKMLEDNRERHNSCFPKRSKIGNDEIKNNYLNGINKFDQAVGSNTL